MEVNEKEFLASFDLAVENSIVEQNTAMRRLILGVFTRCIKASPVDKGRFRSAWTVSLDRRTVDDSSHENEKPKGHLDMETFSRGHLTVKSFDLRANKVTYIQNNMPYAARLEYGYSTQASQGVARISAKEELNEFNRTSAQ